MISNYTTIYVVIILYYIIIYIIYFILKIKIFYINICTIHNSDMLNFKFRELLLLISAYDYKRALLIKEGC